MSYIAFHSKHHLDVHVRGSERFYMQNVMTDMAAAILPHGVGRPHPFSRLIPDTDRDWRTLLAGNNADRWVSTYLSSHADTKLFFNGELHETTETVLNTILALDSDVLSLMCKIWGNCESHGWFPPENHNWFADVMRQGLDRHILRSDAGWEKVIKMFEADLSDPIVMSYSVTDGFPNAELAGKSYEEEEEWWETTSEAEQWDVCMAALKEKPYEKISSETLNGMWFRDAATLWDAMESPEWKGEV